MSSFPSHAAEVAAEAEEDALVVTHTKKPHDALPKHKGRSDATSPSRRGVTVAHRHTSPNPLTHIFRRLVRLRTRMRSRSRQPKTFVAAAEDTAVAAAEAGCAGAGVGS